MIFKPTFRQLALSTILPLLLLAGCSSSVSPDAPGSYSLHSVATGGSTIVATESNPASQIGIEVLKKGGNAFDAAIAISFALSVYRPQSTGIGGGGFLLGSRSDKPGVFFLDMRERAPDRATSSYYKKGDKRLLSYGGGAVATPGLVRGLHRLFLDHSSKKLTWKELINPSIHLARNGFPVYPHLSHAIEIVLPELEKEEFSSLRNLLMPNGTLLKQGDIFRQPDLARTLEKLAEGGVSSFYTGDIARQIVNQVQNSDGLLSIKDMTEYQVRYRQPIQGTFRGYTVFGAPPPSSGGVVNQLMLQLFDRLNPDNQPFSAADLHARAEVLRSGFAVRNTHLGDPEYVEVSLEKLLSAKTTEKLTQHIKNRLQNKPALHSAPSGDDNGGTTHFCVVDSLGNIVSSTQSINYYFGSLLIAGDTGVILNNTMNDFSADRSNLFELTGGQPNRVEGGKTPLSSMSPTLVFRDKKFVLALGSPGGPKIISAVWNVLLNTLFYQAPLPESVAWPRVHHQHKPDQLFYDGAVDALQNRLSSSPYPLRYVPRGIGNVSAIMKTTDKQLLGVTDPRREGTALQLSTSSVQTP